MENGKRLLSDVVLCAACEAFMYLKGTFTPKTENLEQFWNQLIWNKCPLHLLCPSSQLEPVLDSHPYHTPFHPRWFECELEQVPIVFALRQLRVAAQRLHQYFAGLEQRPAYWGRDCCDQ